MSEAPGATLAAKGLGGAVGSALGAAIGFLTGESTGLLGTSLGHVLAIAGAGCGLWFALIYQRYLGVLAASAPAADPDERAGYLSLRRNLAEGGAIARLYAERLQRFLGGLERVFGDAGMADQSLFPQAFGLKNPAPLWTAPAFDRCLLLALVYPIVTISLIWLISGRVGPAEEALGLAPDVSGWRRVVATAAVTLVVFAYLKSVRVNDWKSFLWFAIGATVSITIAVYVTGFDVVAGTIPIGIAGASVAALGGVVTIGFAVAGAVAVAIVFGVAVAVTVKVAVALTFAVASVALTVAVAFVALAVAVTVAFIARRAIRRRRHGIFLFGFVIVTCLACLISAYSLASLFTWEKSGPLLLFLGLLTLVNAPFDWASLGLTRALLRRGLELGGWWPLLLAIVDAACAALFVALLTFVMLLAVQSFDSLAVLGGGTAVLPLDPLLAGIGNRATALDPQYWWIYALLLTTLIPSLINLGIGGASWLRGLPGLPALLLRFLPAEKAVRTYDRAWIALVLALQTVGGMILGVAVQALIFWAVIGHALPWFGAGLLDMARDLVALDLPGRLWPLIGLVP